MAKHKQALKRALTLLNVIAVMTFLGYHTSSRAQEGKDRNQAPNVQPSVAPSPPQNVQLSNAPRQPSPEEIALRAQLQTIREYNDKLLSTVYWALGTVVTIVVLLIGFSWFASFRVSSREKEALKQELQGTLKQDVSSLHDALKADTERRFASFKEEVDKLHAEMKKSATSAGEAAAGKLRGQLTNLGWEVHDIRIELLVAEAKKWEAESILTIAIRRHAKILRLRVKRDTTYSLPETLDEIKRLLQKMTSINADSTRDVLNALDCLPSEYAVVASGLRERILTLASDKT